MTTGQNEATDAERYAAALKAVIDYAGEMLQQQRTMAPEEVLDLIGHEIQLELCFPQRWIASEDPNQPALDEAQAIENMLRRSAWYAGSDAEVFAVDPAGDGAMVGARRDSEGRIHTRVVDWQDPTPRSLAQQAQAREKLEAALPPGFWDNVIEAKPRGSMPFRNAEADVEPPLPSSDLRPLMERVNETLRDMVAVQRHGTFFQRGTAFERITRGDD